MLVRVIGQKDVEIKIKKDTEKVTSNNKFIYYLSWLVARSGQI